MEAVKSADSRGNESDRLVGPWQDWDHIAEGYDRFVTDTEIWLANEALKRVVYLKSKLFYCKNVQ